MKQPCEIIVWYVIPAIRSQLAKDLLSFGMKQKEVSEIMDITQPAVSQYITDKRGSGIKLRDEVKQLVTKLAKDLADNVATKSDIVKRNCEICNMVDIKDVIEQLGLDLEDFGEDCDSCCSNSSPKYYLY